MSRGGRGATRGGFGARGGFGTSNPPPMGLTFADVQAMSREQSALYPVCPLSVSHSIKNYVI
jgi:DNA-directed RNA polymerase III subunit RPC7